VDSKIVVLHYEPIPADLGIEVQVVLNVSLLLGRMVVLRIHWLSERRAKVCMDVVELGEKDRFNHGILSDQLVLDIVELKVVPNAIHPIAGELDRFAICPLTNSAREKPQPISKQERVDVYDGCLVFMNLGGAGNVSLEQHPKVIAGAFNPVGTISVLGESTRSPAVLPGAIENLFPFLSISHSLLYASSIFM